MHEGSCLCGAVTFTVQGALPQPDLCHCSKCRRWSGHAFASADVPRDALVVRGDEHVRWFASSEKVRRGFCGTCGSSLFFDPLDRAKHNWIGVAMGAFTTPTHTTLKMHIFTADQGDYYTLADGLPQNRQ
jgi:hypothetical protein